MDNSKFTSTNKLRICPFGEFCVVTW